MLEVIRSADSHYDEGDAVILDTVEQQTAAESCAKIAEEERDRFAIEVLKFISSENTPVSIMYGDQEHRFATNDEDLTPEQLLQLFKQSQ